MTTMDRRLRWLGMAAALGCAAIYGLIGLGVLTVGESTTEATTDLLGFGVLMGGFSLVTALAVWRLRSRTWLALVAVVQLLPLLGYVAVAGVREPPYETWGVLIKVGQAIVLVAAAVLALRATPRPNPSTTPLPEPSTKGQAA
jgi:hypothetical protein